MLRLGAAGNCLAEGEHGHGHGAGKANGSGGHVHGPECAHLHGHAHDEIDDLSTASKSFMKAASLYGVEGNACRKETMLQHAKDCLKELRA